MRFQLWKSTRGKKEWHWHLLADNSEVIAHGEGYSGVRDCVHAIELVKLAGVQDAHVENLTAAEEQVPVNPTGETKTMTVTSYVIMEKQENMHIALHPAYATREEADTRLEALAVGSQGRYHVEEVVESVPVQEDS